MERKLPTPIELFGIEAGPGWRSLIDPIVNRIQELNKQGAIIEITQIKEKFGTLCFYVQNAPDEIRDMIRAAEAQSIHICERCGRPAKRIVSTDKWIYTLCPDCLKEKGITVLEEE